MHALLAYGSLIHPDELARHGLHRHPCAPVRVRGYRRSFCQEPSWRRGRAEERAVLTVRPLRGAWFNAVLVQGFDAAILPELDERERGYTRVRVEGAHLEPYPSASLGDCGEVHLYTGRSEKYNERILPHDDYLALCVEGARRWGRAFLDDFLRSTYVQGRTPLRDHAPGLAPSPPARG